MNRIEVQKFIKKFKILDIIIKNPGLSKTQIKINLNEVPLLLKGAIGNRLIKLNQDEKIIGISKG